MKTLRSAVSLALLGAFIAVTLPGSIVIAAHTPSLANLRHGRRILIVSTLHAQDGSYRRQMLILAKWRKQGEDRDLTVVRIVGDKVSGASDPASMLRTRFGLATRGFSVALIGKDGRQALKTVKPLTSSDLEGTIDAMPMRRAGGR